MPAEEARAAAELDSAVAVEAAGEQREEAQPSADAALLPQADVDAATALLLAMANQGLLGADGCLPGWVLQEVQDLLSGHACAPLLAPVPHSGPVAPVAPLLPPSTKPHLQTLVLDLDGTLLGSLMCHEASSAHAAPEYSFDAKHVWLRPGVRSFLQAVRPFFEVVLFTAANDSWANRALEELDPNGELFDHRLYREHTVPVPGWDWVKDLSRLGRDLSRVVIVDDNELMFQAQPCNAIWVEAFDPINAHDDVLDQVLQLLLLMVLPAPDVTACLQRLLGVRVCSQQSTALQYALLAAQALQLYEGAQPLTAHDAAAETADAKDAASAAGAAVSGSDIAPLCDQGVPAPADDLTDDPAAWQQLPLSWLLALAAMQPDESDALAIEADVAEAMLADGAAGAGAADLEQPPVAQPAVDGAPDAAATEPAPAAPLGEEPAAAAEVEPAPAEDAVAVMPTLAAAPAAPVAAPAAAAAAAAPEFATPVRGLSLKRRRRGGSDVECSLPLMLTPDKSPLGSSAALAAALGLELGGLTPADELLSACASPCAE